MDCPTCHHPPHDPGTCKFDNCGESTLTRLTARRELTFLPARIDHDDCSFTYYGYDCGHRVYPKIQRKGKDY